MEYLSEKDAETLFDALEKRYLLSHTYEESIAFEAEKLIKHNYAPILYNIYDQLESKRSKND